MSTLERNQIASLVAFCTGIAVAFVLLTAIHETVLRRAGHVPAVVDDESLWCVARRQVAALGREDVLLLGASRMQTDIDEATLAALLPGRRIVNLAISGGGTSLPVFHDIVENTAFAGIVILDETESTMASDAGIEQGFVDAYTHTFTLDRLVNRDVDTWLQSRLVCLGPGETCTDLWPRLAARGRVPPPKPNVTSFARYTRADYSLIDPALLEEIRSSRLAPPPSTIALHDPADAAVSRWGDLVTAFRERGGRVVFVRLPVSHERWALDDSGAAASQAWSQIMSRLEVPSVLCNGPDAESIRDLRILDHSHINGDHTGRFTTWLVERVNRQLTESAR